MQSIGRNPIDNADWTGAATCAAEPALTYASKPVIVCIMQVVMHYLHIGQSSSCPLNGAVASLVAPDDFGFCAGYIFFLYSWAQTAELLATPLTISHGTLRIGK